jgi:hypothetical protein
MSHNLVQKVFPNFKSWEKRLVELYQQLNRLEMFDQTDCPLLLTAPDISPIRRVKI